MKRPTVILLVVALLFLGVPLALPMFLFYPSENGASCAVPVGNVDQLGNVAGYEGDQLRNAALIMSAANDMGLGLRGQQVGVMTAMEESTLRNISYGDNAINPDGSVADSIGLFQQQGGWGSVKDRMDPYTAATLFFNVLAKLPGWESMAPETAAHAVQVNDHAWRYAEHWDDAQSVVAAIGGNGSCAPGTPTDGWTNPIGTQSWGTYPNHAGGAMDVHVPIGTPVYAPAAGMIVNLSESCGGTVIGVQVDAQYTVAFAHMSAVQAKVGSMVQAGELIGLSGASGSCVDGAHLHIEVRVGPNPHMWGSFTPAYRFFREHGVQMGPCQTGCDLYPM